MLSENIKNLRKAKGLTQEELAIRINVVRQTVSKWEKGLSVPDAELLQRIAEVLEVSVNQLLGADFQSEASTNEIAQQLARINEQLAIKNRRWHRFWKMVLILLIILFAWCCVCFALNMTVTESNTTVVEEVKLLIKTYCHNPLSPV